MKYCSKCGKEIMDEAKFCDGCGAPVQTVKPQLTSENEIIEPESEVVTQATEAIESVSSEVETTHVGVITTDATTVVKTKKKSKIGKTLWIIIAAVVVAVIVAVVAIANTVKLNEYKTILEETYNAMAYGAEEAESYASLESKVWRNCIMESASIETDKYTKNEYGNYFSDFNDALQKFHTGEYLTYSEVSSNVDVVNNYMAELKDCPDKLEDEYRALKEMYVAYSDLTDLVVGDSSYSCNSFSDALETAKSNYKTAKSAASLMIG